VRKETYDVFDSVELSLKKIGLYGSMFLNDPNIMKASEELVFATLVATESAIGFYTSWQGERILKRRQFNSNRLWLTKMNNSCPLLWGHISR
jgi:hypothetical protein